MTSALDRLSELIVPVTDALTAAFLVVLGANLGSFVNVLAYRLPRGESVVRGGSRCPACGAAIRWHDNVPVVGWFVLRGRCRACGTAISSRYPLVEAACAVLVGAVASAELLTGGATLPGERFGSHRWGSDGLLLHTDWLLVAVCALHCWLLVTLLAWGLLRFDGRAVPRRWLVASLLFAAAVVAALPGVQPAAADAPRAAATGLALAVCLGAAAAVASGPDAGAALGGALGVLGIALGGRALAAIVVLLAAAAGATLVCSRVFRPRAASGDRQGRSPLVLLLVAATAAYLLMWRWLDGAFLGMIRGVVGGMRCS